MSTPINDSLDIYVKVIKLLLSDLFNSYVDWVYISYFEPLHLYVIDSNIIEIHFMTILAQGYIL